MPTLKEMNAEFEAKQAKLAAVFEEAKTEGGDYDFDKVKSVEGDTTQAKVEKVRQASAELEGLWDKIEKQMKLEQGFKTLGDRMKEPVQPFRHAEPNGRQVKTFGQLVFGSSEYKNFVGGGVRTKRDWNISVPEYGLAELKALFETGAGWAPESVRLPGFVEAVTTPPTIIDIIPSGSTNQAAIVYMEETTRTHAAAEKAEGVAFAESTFALTQRSSTVRKVTDSVPVTDEQLEDVAMAESYLGDRLRFGLRQKLSSQCLVGDGNAPNLLGILNFTGIQTQAKGADPTPDAIYKAMTKVRVTGRATPTHVVLHPNDWEPIRLLRTADGIYIWGSPSEAGPERIWGLPVVQTSEETENTGLVGSFQKPWITLFDRRGINVEVGYVNTQFTEGERTIRADLRACNVGFRGAAFCKVTGI